MVVEANEFYREYLDFTPSEPQRRVLAWAADGGGAGGQTARRKAVRQKALWIHLPCGEGKTEAVVAPFLAQFVERRFTFAPRLIYVLPTQALSNSIAARIQGYARKIADAYGADIIVETQHGGSPRDSYFFADIVVTTLDQFVYGYARATSQVGRHLELPAGAIAGSVVVFDEAHMFSPYSHAILRAMIEILRAAGVPVIVMTATMPDGFRDDLFKRIPYDMVTIDTNENRRLQRTVPVRLHEEVLWSDEKRLADAAKGIIAKDAKVLVVLNTVDKAQKVYSAVKEFRDDVVLIHSRFMLKDRRALEEKVTAMLGRHGTGGVVISTQVCEAGLDVSANVLLTELAPGDSLIQRGGRTGRFEDNLAGQAHVFLEVAEDNGLSVTYEDEPMQQTLDYLRTTPDADLADWTKTKELANRLAYRVSEAEAGESLFELFEATLFADRRPQGISVREGHPVGIWFGSEVELAASDLASSPGEPFRDRLLMVELRQALRHRDYLLRGTKFRRVHWNDSEHRLATKEQGTLLPFATYLVSATPEKYSTELGVIW